MNKQILLILGIVSLTIAQTCTTEQYLNGSVCTFCKDAIPNCKNCSAGYPPTCDGCNGHYRLTNSTPPPSCQRCSDAGCWRCNTVATYCD